MRYTLVEYCRAERLFNQFRRLFVRTHDHQRGNFGCLPALTGEIRKKPSPARKAHRHRQPGPDERKQGDRVRRAFQAFFEIFQMIGIGRPSVANSLQRFVNREHFS